MNRVADKENPKAESSATAVRQTSVQKRPCVGEIFLPDTIFNKALIRVAIVDDQYPVLEAFSQLLNREARVQTVGAFASAQKALEELPSILPDVVLMDVRMPGMNGIECTKQLKQLIPSIKIIIVTALGSEDIIAEAIKAGAAYFLSKPFRGADLVNAIARVANPPPGRIQPVWINVWRRADYCRTASASSKGGFGLIETNAMRLLAQGRAYKEVSATLNISASKTHKVIHSIYLKLGAHSRWEAIQKWQRVGARALGESV